MSAVKNRCGGLWTESKFSSFIKSALRSASNRWSPKYACKKRARVARNQYRCALCHSLFANSECRADHIVPVVDPVRGFQGWDEFIRRLFVEVDGYQCLCDACHDAKTAREREVRKSVKTR